MYLRRYVLIASIVMAILYLTIMLIGRAGISFLLRSLDTDALYVTFFLSGLILSLVVISLISGILYYKEKSWAIYSYNLLSSVLVIVMIYFIISQFGVLGYIPLDYSDKGYNLAEWDASVLYAITLQIVTLIISVGIFTIGILHYTRKNDSIPN